MRTASYLFLTLVLTLAAGSIASAATSQEATYIVGNLDGVHTGATGYVRTDDANLMFRSGKVTIETPYAKITSAELGATLTHSSDAPRYKFWERFGNKTVYQNVTVNFKDSGGKEQTMTLELTAAAALEIHSTLELRTGLKAKRQQEEWWGDSIWKTTRNQKSWDTQSAALASK
jgi:hypothetical protein